MTRDATILPNHHHAISTIVDAVGEEELWSRYPGLRAASATLEDGQDRADAALSLFLAIRADLPDDAGLFDRLLIDAARRDLHGLDCPEPDDDDSRDRIGAAMDLPFELADYLCHLSRTRKFLYVANPKVACTAIKYQLQQAQAAGRIAYAYYGQEHLPVLSPLLAPSSDPATFLEALQSPEWFRFTFVRDPFNRVLSCYLDKIIAARRERERLLPQLGLDPTGPIPTFGAFLRAIEAQPEDERDIHWAVQYRLTRPDRIAYDFIGRLERFDADFAHVLARLGIVRKSYEKSHATGAAQKLAKYFGAEEIAIARRIYAEDFQAFGYDPLRLTAQAVQAEMSRPAIL